MPEIKYGRSTFWLSSLIFKNKPHDFVEEIINNFKIENIDLDQYGSNAYATPLQ